MNTIETTCGCGPIRGLDCGSYVEYRGIRYGRAQRFQYPVITTHWEGIYDATGYRDCGYQRRSFEDDEICNPFYHREFREHCTFTYSEDCQYLNLVVPKESEGKNYPVLIYIHGGSFTGGSSNEAHINGEEFARAGVIFVSFNYRLGPFGFCSHPELTDDQGRCGNYGLYDQYTAMQWVRDNIAFFGGDPNKITLMGQSAGAMSVDIHSSSPMETGWFAGLVMSSGAGLQRLVLRPVTPEKSRKFWDAVMTRAGALTIEELKAVPSRTLYYAWLDATREEGFTTSYTLPVYDGQLLTRESFSKRKLSDIPTMIGMTVTDMAPFVMKQIICKWGRIHKKYNHSPCYTYLFARELPGDHAGAWHSSDLLYFFSSYPRNWRPFTEIDENISNQMSRALTAFTKSGDPNCTEIPQWHSNARYPMSFDESTQEKPWDVKKLWRNTVSRGHKEG